MSEEMPQGQRTVTDEDLKRVIKLHDDPFVTSSEVADQLDITRQAVHNRLMDLHNNDEVKRKKSGPRAVIWWI